MEPQIQYCTTSDGVSIAYFAIGEGSPVVYATNIWGEIDFYRLSPSVQRNIQLLVDAGHLVIRYDGRGMGMSARDQTDFSLAARVRDLDAIAATLHEERFALLGFNHGSPTAIAYAAAYPNRVSHLVLARAFASGARFYDVVPALNIASGLREMAPERWAFYCLSMANAVMEFTDSELAQRVAEMFRTSMTPETMLSYRSETQSIDVTSLLSSLTVPTLVVHMERDPFASRELAHDLAIRIPNARLVSTQGLAGQEAVVDFLRPPGAARPIRDVATVPAAAAPAFPSGMTAILFTDIVSSTALTERMGDAVFRDASRTLDEQLRTAIRDAGGTPIEGKVLGDGVMAIFPSASQAITAAVRCNEVSARSELQLHLGIHAGDVIREPGNVYGGAVNIASRICGLSAPGEILVSDVVRGMARSSAGVTFKDRGEQEMKGVGEPVRVYAVRWR